MKTRIQTTLIADYDVDWVADYLTYAGLTGIRYGLFKHNLILASGWLTTTRLVRSASSEVVVQTSLSALAIALSVVGFGTIVGQCASAIFPTFPMHSLLSLFAMLVAYGVICLLDASVHFNAKCHFSAVTSIEMAVGNATQIKRFNDMMSAEAPPAA